MKDMNVPQPSRDGPPEPAACGTGYMRCAPGEHTLPPLPYPPDALEPVIGAQSLRIHHDILHRGYVEGLNNTERALSEACRLGDEKMIRFWEGQLAYNASGDILHSIYWTVMCPQGTGGAPHFETKTALENCFGSVEAFRSQFESATLKVQASGWGILGYNPAFSNLEILQCEKHQDNLIWGVIPILVCDVWEHAYYLQYQNRRGQFIKDWWSLINWKQVERRLMLARRGKMPLTM